MIALLLLLSQFGQPVAHAAPPPLTSFVLAKGTGPLLILKFDSTRPNWNLNLKAPLVIQLNTPEGVELEPSFITRENWPKTGDRLPIAIKGGVHGGKEIRITGGAAYTVCESKTKECRKAKSRIEFAFTP